MFSEHHDKMNCMISMLARSQSKRLNEQRVSLSSLPGVRAADEVDAPPELAEGNSSNLEALLSPCLCDFANFDFIVGSNAAK